MRRFMLEKIVILALLLLGEIVGAHAQNDAPADAVPLSEVVKFLSTVSRDSQTDREQLLTVCGALTLDKLKEILEHARNLSKRKNVLYALAKGLAMRCAEWFRKIDDQSSEKKTNNDAIHIRELMKRLYREKVPDRVTLQRHLLPLIYSLELILLYRSPSFSGHVSSAIDEYGKSPRDQEKALWKEALLATINEIRAFRFEAWDPSPDDLYLMVDFVNHSHDLEQKIDHAVGNKNWLGWALHARSLLENSQDKEAQPLIEHARLKLSDMFTGEKSVNELVAENNPRYDNGLSFHQLQQRIESLCGAGTGFFGFWQLVYESFLQLFVNNEKYLELRNDTATLLLTLENEEHSDQQEISLLLQSYFNRHNDIIEKLLSINYNDIFQHQLIQDVSVLSRRYDAIFHAQAELVPVTYGVVGNHGNTIHDDTPVAILPTTEPNGELEEFQSVAPVIAEPEHPSYHQPSPGAITGVPNNRRDLTNFAEGAHNQGNSWGVHPLFRGYITF